MKTKLLAALTLLLAIAGTTSCKKSSETYKVGVECGYAPYFWTETEAIAKETTHVKTKEGQYCIGFDANVIKHVEAEIGAKFEFYMLDFDAIVTSLVTGEVDLAIAGISPTEERKLEVNFSDNYYESKQVLVVKESSSLANATSLSAFSGKKVVAQSGTLQDDLIDQISGVVHKTPLTDFSSLIQEVKSGNADAFVTELVVATSIINNNPDLKIIDLANGQGFTVSPGDEATAIAVNKNKTDLLTKINDALKTITSETKEEWFVAAFNSSN